MMYNESYISESCTIIDKSADRIEKKIMEKQLNIRLVYQKINEGKLRWFLNVHRAGKKRNQFEEIME